MAKSKSTPSNSEEPDKPTLPPPPGAQDMLAMGYTVLPDPNNPDYRILAYSGQVKPRGGSLLGPSTKKTTHWKVVEVNYDEETDRTFVTVEDSDTTIDEEV